ncbi:hypothetical protein GQ457_03G026060 [Hibiscus cannabinus]
MMRAFLRISPVMVREFASESQLVDVKLYELLGERTTTDDEKPSKKKEKKEKPAKVESKTVVVDTPAHPSEEELNPFSIFPAPEDNIKLCTLEFETRRASYYWLLHVLDLYQPYVWEYSRLNVTNIVMSKRKLNYIVTNKYADGWDDPRLMILAGLRCRGVTLTAINSFVRGIGITRSLNMHILVLFTCYVMIRLDRLEYHIREELNKTTPHVLVVLHPLKVIIYSSITNLESGSVLDLNAKKWPDAHADDTSAFYEVPFSNVVYIGRSDFRMKDSKDYYGLAPGKSALYAFPIKCTDVILADDKETVLEIQAEYDPSKKSKPKVAEPSPGSDPLKIEVRLFETLLILRLANPAELDYWLVDLNPNSKVVVPAAYAVPSLRNVVVGDTFQFERLGYFTVDKDSTAKKLVFNRTVMLKDTYSKAGK